MARQGFGPLIHRVVDAAWVARDPVRAAELRIPLEARIHRSLIDEAVVKPQVPTARIRSRSRRDLGQRAAARDVRRQQQGSVATVIAEAGEADRVASSHWKVIDPAIVELVVEAAADQVAANSTAVEGGPSTVSMQAGMVRGATAVRVRATTTAFHRRTATETGTTDTIFGIDMG